MTIKLYNGDCADVMAQLESESVDAIVTDPPYGLAFMGAEWDSFGGSTGKETIDERRRKMNEYLGVNAAVPAFASSHGHTPKLSEMHEFQEAMTPIFEEALRVAKPGAHLLCFGGTRTFHRMASAIEDAGWEIRDCIMWVYGSGFPKSMDVAKAIDKTLGAERKKRGGDGEHSGNVDFGMKNRCPKCGKPYFSSNPCTCPRNDKLAVTDEAKEWDGWGTCLKPAWEPIIVARKPLDGTVANNVLTWGTGAINIDACRVPTEDDLNGGRYSHNRDVDSSDQWNGGRMTNYSGKYAVSKNEYVQPEGRFPANLAHDGSDEVVSLFPQSNGQQGKVAGTEPSRTGDNGIYGHYGPRNEFVPRNDSGSAARFFNTFSDGEESAERTYADKGSTDFAAKPGMRREPVSADRFFYCAKATKKDRGEGNDHPTVKPNALMRWLVKMVCPRGGTVMDPFMGSGSTGLACIDEGMDFIGIEREQHYVEIAEKRFDGRQLSMDLLD